MLLVWYVILPLNTVLLTMPLLLILPFPQLRTARLTQVQLHLAVSLILSSLVYTALSHTPDTRVNSQGNPSMPCNALCVVVVLASQYIILCSVSWIGCTAWTLGRITSETNNHGLVRLHSMTKWIAACWGAPAILPLATAIGAWSMNDREGHYYTSYVGQIGKSVPCWVQFPWKWIGFLAPIYIILVFSGYSLLKVIKTVIQKSGTNRIYQRTTIVMFGVVVGVGGPWVAGGMTSHVTGVETLLFVVFTSLQGPLLFISLVLIEDEVRENTVRLCCRNVTTDEEEKEDSTEEGGDTRSKRLGVAFRNIVATKDAKVDFCEEKVDVN